MDTNEKSKAKLLNLSNFNISNKSKNSTSKSPNSRTSSNKSSSASDKNKLNNQNKIIEVYNDNFIQEIKHLSEYLEEYNYIGMDTEFPGIVFLLSTCPPDFYYRSVEKNVNGLNLIQLGVSIYNSKGEQPEDCGTWQFNFRFDTAVDKYSQDSINLLINSGIKFEKLKTEGISQKLFAEYFFSSGLILSPNIHWICYHGSYDFAYLLKLILGDDFPKDENKFIEEMRTYFPSHYDIKILVQGKEKCKGGLNKLATSLGINRYGDVHQAGSDSKVTADVFFSLLKSRIIDNDTLKNCENIIYGLGKGADDCETKHYNLFFPGVNINSITTHQSGINNMNNLNNNLGNLNCNLNMNNLNNINNINISMNNTTNINININHNLNINNMTNINNISHSTALNLNTPMYIPSNISKSKGGNLLGNNYGIMNNIVSGQYIGVKNPIMMGYGNGY